MNNKIAMSAQNEVKHSTLPWSFIRHDNVIAAADHKMIAIQSISSSHGSEVRRDADSVFIVKACNAHDALVAALKEMVDHAVIKQSAESRSAAFKRAESAIKLATHP